MSRIKKILILYHSGAGSTKCIAEVFHERLNEHFSCDIESISLSYDYEKINAYDFILMGFPTYHCSPSQSIIDFIEEMPKLSRYKKAFVFTTYGLYSGNTERIFTKLCKDKNIKICFSRGYRAPATDGALLLPAFHFMFKFEKNLSSKLKSDLLLVNDFITEKKQAGDYIPRFKFYTILNFPNMYLGKLHKYKLRIFKIKCINCNTCVDECIRGCWANNKSENSWESYNCEFCFKCIHHCPTSAIVLSDKTKKKPKMNEDFYIELKNNLI